MRPACLLPIALSLLVATPAAAQSVIGIAAPLSGPAATLGQQVRLGGETAAAASSVETRVEDDTCTAEGGARAARTFAEAKVSAVIGFLCSESLEAALPILKEAGIPTITVGVRQNAITDSRAKTGSLVWRLAPRADAEQAAIAAILPPLWADALFAIVDDGTIYGRELAETLRLAAEQRGLKPVYVDTFRPQMDNQIALAGRLRKAGATHVFLGGDMADAAILGRDAAELGYGLTIAGGEAFRASAEGPPLAEGTLMIGLPEWAEAGDPAVLAAFAERKLIPEGYVMPAYAAAQIALTALKAGTAAEVLGRPEGFVTAIGPVRFDAKGDLAENPYRLFSIEGGAFQPVAP